MKTLNSLEELASHYGEPMEAALRKEVDHLSLHYCQFIEASPFLILATYGEKGIDCSPRGDPAGFVRIQDNKTLLIPDRRGNNRVDSLKNIVMNPKVGLIFLVPNVGEAIRVSGQASIIVDEALCRSFEIKGKPASSVISVKVEKAYYQCQKAIARSRLWDANTYKDRKELPSAGQMTQYFAAQHSINVDAEEYDKNYPEHMKKTIY